MPVVEALRAASRVERMVRGGKAALRLQAWLHSDLISRDEQDRPDSRQGTAPPLP
jgi:hypothetical protein